MRLKILFLTALCCLFFTLFAAAQTACEANYKLLCEEEKQILIEKKKLECRLLDISKMKQELVSCMTNERNSVQLDRLKSILVETINEIERLKVQPKSIVIPCVSGNCN